MMEVRVKVKVGYDIISYDVDYVVGGWVDG